MKLGKGILKHTIDNCQKEKFHFYNSLVLTDDLAFQRIYFKGTPVNVPRIYWNDNAPENIDDLPLQTRSLDQNQTLLKIAILIASNAGTE